MVWTQIQKLPCHDNDNGASQSHQGTRTKHEKKFASLYWREDAQLILIN